jgi:hypothetical protein
MGRPEGEQNGCLVLIVFLFGAGLVCLTVAWFVSLVGHALGQTPTYPQFDRHDAAWIHAHYALPGLGYVLTVLALVVGVPASASLSAELWSGRPRVERVAWLAGLLLAIVLAIAVSPAGPRH